MLQYLIILLDDTSVSYCHYENRKTERRLIALDDLKAGIFFAMKENLMIQFVYPNYELPQEYKDAIESIDHSKIMPASHSENANVIVFNEWETLSAYAFEEEPAYVLRTSKGDFFKNYSLLEAILPKVSRLNIALTDTETFTDADLDMYKSVLENLADRLKELYGKGKLPQLNLLTDRMMLDKMNNCNAGWENVTLAPDGKFYVCPAFYQESEGYAIGSLKEGLDIKNPQLYRLDHAPLCRHCDAYQCKRCIWLNRKTTMEVNTPSHEQCVTAHLERNVSRSLLLNIRKTGTFLPDKEIEEISYLDPFDVRKEF